MMTKSVKELAALVGGEVAGDGAVEITGAADIQDAVDGDVVFAETPRLFEQARESRASAIITNEGARDTGKPVIAVDNPRYAFAQVLEVFSPPQTRQAGIHPTSVPGANVTIGENPSIGRNVHIGENVTIGRNAWIHPFVFIDNDVRLGDDIVICPFVSVHRGVSIGNNVMIHSGTIIGSDGFGYTPVGGKHHKIPQIGAVVVGDDVEIGANVTIDKARTGKTEIGRGTKIDNLVHIAHNVTIGEDCLVIAQVGISGSVHIGDRVILAGQAGLKDNISIGDDAIICARAGVMGDIEPSAFVSGYPARPHKDQMRMHAAQNRLPEMLKQLKALKKQVEDLEDRLNR